MLNRFTYTAGKIRRSVKNFFGIYEPHWVYRVAVKSIKIQPEYKLHRIREKKWNRKLRYFQKTGQFQSTLILTKDFTLVDGYSTYCIAKLYNMDKVPAQFAPGVSLPMQKKKAGELK